MDVLSTLRQIANSIASAFGSNCEVVIHDLKSQNLEQSIVYIVNGHVTNRKIGDGPSAIVLNTLHKNPESLVDEPGYLLKTSDGRILKSSTSFIRDDDGSIHYIFGINYDITKLTIIESALHELTTPVNTEKKPQKVNHSVNELLEQLIEQSVELVGKPVALMNKEDKVKAIQFLNDQGAFLITKSGDKVSNYFGISKYTLYSYIDVNK